MKLARPIRALLDRRRRRRTEEAIELEAVRRDPTAGSLYERASAAGGFHDMEEPHHR